MSTMMTRAYVRITMRTSKVQQIKQGKSIAKYIPIVSYQSPPRPRITYVRFGINPEPPHEPAPRSLQTPPHVPRRT